MQIKNTLKKVGSILKQFLKTTKINIEIAIISLLGLKEDLMTRYYQRKYRLLTEKGVLSKRIKMRIREITSKIIGGVKVISIKIKSGLTKLLTKLKGNGSTE